jgi:hypothetical protein
MQPTPQRGHQGKPLPRPLQSSADSMTLAALITRRTLLLALVLSISLLLI